MDLRLIFGPTCTGKTSTAVALAQQTGLPVLSLDRVQCCPQLSTGSGRPTVEELKGTSRLYLDDRPLVKGIIAAKQAHERLMGRCIIMRPTAGLFLRRIYLVAQVHGAKQLLECGFSLAYYSPRVSRRGDLHERGQGQS